MIIGLTGPMGSGKSFLAHLFEKKGWVMIDVDAIGKAVLKQREMIAKLSTTFGEDILSETGEVIPSVLGNKVFQDHLELQKLNSVMHPEMKSMIKDIIHKENKNIIIHAALLFQMELESLCDLIINIWVNEDTLIQRVLGRASYFTEEMIKEIISSQKKYNDFSNLSDISINNNGTPTELTKKFERLYEQLKEG